MESKIECATKSEFYDAILHLYTHRITFTAYTDSLTITIGFKVKLTKAQQRSLKRKFEQQDA